MRKFVFIIFLLLLWSSCFNSIKESALIGKFELNNNHLDVITLYKNHSYDHTYTNTKGMSFSCHGKWNYNGQDISFHDFNFYNDLGASGGEGIWISRISKNGGRINLNVNDDTDEYFEKK